MPASARVVHVSRGRMRLKVDGTARQRSSVLANLASRCDENGDSVGVAVDDRTGSALISWDPDGVTIDEAVELVRSADAALQDVTPPQVREVVGRVASRSAQELWRRLGAADRRVDVATDGAVDLRMLAPMAIGALSLRQLLRTGPQLSRMPWYMLAYYAFDTFHKLHSRPLRATMPSQR